MSQLRGIIPALVTPTTSEGIPDLDRVESVIEHVLTAGVHGVFVLGGQGEFWAYDHDEHEEVVGAVVAAVAGRVPVLAGVSAETTRQSRRLAERAAASGADLMVLMPPMAGRLTDGELERHAIEVAEATDRALVLYHHPSRAGTPFSVELVRSLSRHTSIVAIKDSGGSMEHLQTLLDETGDDIDVLVGVDSLIGPALQAGCVGAIASTGNVIPGLLVDLYDACQRGDAEEAARLQERVLPLRNAYALGTFPVVVKEAMGLIGIPVGGAAPPVAPLSEEARAQLQAVLLEVLG